MDTTHTIIIGAGPHGLAAAAHLRRSGIECRVFGIPMDFWKTMPIGMLLRSNKTATCIAEYDGPLSLRAFMSQRGAEVTLPVPLDTFVDYGMWVTEQVAPDADRRRISAVERDGVGFTLTLGDGSQVHARRVVVAAGIAPFAQLPEFTEGLPEDVVSHTSQHRHLGRFRGQRVLVVGGGQSALESAALMAESGAEVHVAVRAEHLTWLHGGKYHRMLGKLSPLVYAPTDVGPMGISRVVAAPGLFRRLPRRAQDPMAHRSIRPAGAAWLKPRLEAVAIHLNATVKSLEPSASATHAVMSGTGDLDVDHVMCGTGYRVDVARYPFLSTSVLSGLRVTRGYPVLRPGMESSVPGLHFLGAPGAYGFGPIMRFVAGGWFGAQTLTAEIVESDRRRLIDPTSGSRRAA